MADLYCKEGVLRNFPNLQKKYLCESLFFNKVAGLSFPKKEILAQVFFCEFCETSKNTFFAKRLLVTASVLDE